MYRHDLHRILHEHAVLTYQTIIPYADRPKGIDPESRAKRCAESDWAVACHKANQAAHLNWVLIVANGVDAV